MKRSAAPDRPLDPPRPRDPERPPDWILTDATVWTGGPTTAAPDPGREGAGLEGGAVALRDGKVLAVGPEDDVMNLKGRDTALFPMEGRFVMPGFVDAHVHLLVGGLQLFRVDLRGVSTREEFMQRVGDRTRTTPPGDWILGGGWNQEDWGGEFPTREWLDRVTPEHPVFLERMDLHMGVANSLALEMAGIDDETPDPENGRIDRDPDTGRPTGLLREKAVLGMGRAIPDLTDAARQSAVRAAALTALSQGITQVHDMGAVQRASESWHSLEILRTLEAAGRLPIRVSSALPVADWQRVAQLVAEEGRHRGRLDWGRVKGFVDGSFGSSTAWFHEPYRHEPERSGAEICDLEQLQADLASALEADLQPAVHAIGDRANDWLLEVCRDLRRQNPDRLARLRIEHAQHLTAAAIEEMGAHEMLLSIQPLHILDDAPWVRTKLGPDRERRSFAFGSLERAGGLLAMGSDWPVAPMDPVGTLWSAVARLLPGSATPEAPWLPDERLSLDSALRAHTWGGARAGGLDGRTGSLDPGKVADLVALSENPFRVPAEELCHRIEVDMTFVDGVLAYRRDDATAVLAAP